MSAGIVRLLAALGCAMAICSCIALLYGCTPSPVVPTPDSGDAAIADAATDANDPPPVIVDAAPQPLTGCALACANMAAAGCAEGVDPSCVKVCQTIQGEPNFSYAMNLTCLTLAKNKAAVQACKVPCK